MLIEQFFLVWNPKGENPKFLHPLKKDAKHEAERLAKLNPGQEFFVLACIGKAVKRDVDWFDIQIDDLPF